MAMKTAVEKKVYRHQYYVDNKEREVALMKKWNEAHPDYFSNYAKLHPEYYRENSKKHQAKIHFGGNKTQVLERDNYTCKKCGMTREEHYELFGRDISVHHIDGNGRYSEHPNHTLSNLETLCLSCHGKVDMELARIAGTGSFKKQADRKKVAEYLKVEREKCSLNILEGRLGKDELSIGEIKQLFKKDQVYLNKNRKRVYNNIIAEHLKNLVNKRITS